MNILIINPMLYTSVQRDVERKDSIKDTMIYGICNAFVELGHKVVLFAGEPFRPTRNESLPFDIVWGRYKLQNVLPISLPWIPDLKRYLKVHRSDFDLIISSEAFSLCTLTAYKCAKDKLICWHELAVHQRAFGGLPSRFWYETVLPSCMPDLKIVARSEQAREFISHYSNNVYSQIVGHGVDLSQYPIRDKKDNSFIVCSRLVPNKRIDHTIASFASYVKKFDSSSILKIAGTGSEEASLRKLASDLGVESHVMFLGQLSHEKLLPLLSEAYALLVSTERDNSLISIIESIAMGTPVITTSIPLNARNISIHNLGIVDDDWNEKDLNKIVEEQVFFSKNCMGYRELISTKHTAEGLISAHNNWEA